MSGGALAVVLLLGLLVAMLVGLFAVFYLCFEPTVTVKPPDAPDAAHELPPPYCVNEAAV